MIPSIAKYRMDWFAEHIEGAYLVGLALDGSNEEMIKEDVAMKLFATAGILGVTVEKDGMSVLILAPDINPHGPQQLHRVNFENQTIMEMLINPWAALFSRGDRYIRLTGMPRHSPYGKADIIVSQRALRRDLWVYARNILGLSLIISTLTATLVYWALNRMIVRPVKELTRNIAAFEANPDRAEHILAPSGRLDEIGAAEHSLAAMEHRIHGLLNQRSRLAALGAGISKISHDLRNILASAQLMSDRLAKSDDPRVKKLSPRLISALDRAVILSRDTLAYGRMEPAALSKAPLNLRALVDEVFEAAATMGVTLNNSCQETFSLLADRTQLYRCLFNLVRNSIDAMTLAGAPSPEAGGPEPHRGTISIGAIDENGVIIIDITDDGPGMPDYAREALFEPFKGSQKPGGSGLGLAIASEITRAHGGELTLAKSDASGTVFKITLPGGAIEPSTPQS